jgi:hypothetical protein
MFHPLKWIRNRFSGGTGTRSLRPVRNIICFHGGDHAESWREGQYREYTRDRPEGWLNLPHRYSPQDRDANGRSLLYRDLEDVWVINREYSRGEKKNGNKLPDELIRKILLYSSNPGDTVCDFFMGKFTTARVALELGRIWAAPHVFKPPGCRGN